MKIIKIGSYTATVSLWMNNYIADNFKMPDGFGLDIDPKSFKHKSSAIRYAKQKLNKLYNGALKFHKLEARK